MPEALKDVGPLFLVHVPQPKSTAAPGKASQRSMAADLRETLRYLRCLPGILMVIAIAMLVNLLIFPALALQPLLVTGHFGGDVLQLGTLQSAFGIGMVAGGVTLSV